MTYEFDGVMISDIVIDIELKRTKGRVTREEAKDLALVANEIRKERDKYKALFEAAKKYIDASPCDPDIYDDQCKAWKKYQDLLKWYEDDKMCTLHGKLEDDGKCDVCESRGLWGK